ncbi:hypothetical protein PIB30_076850 [Stylosanthes scabra]|uniref:Uncharacterized protein n=1 Tax=Stylosanthes scabra TaxID=79078 RepID=A0ABU6SS96_9FABA|nr:hypothetical protein [Stylosanthes scabra]
MCRSRFLSRDDAHFLLVLFTGVPADSPKHPPRLLPPDAPDQRQLHNRARTIKLHQLHNPPEALTKKFVGTNHNDALVPVPSDPSHFVSLLKPVDLSLNASSMGSDAPGLHSIPPTASRQELVESA